MHPLTPCETTQYPKINSPTRFFILSSTYTCETPSSCTPNLLMSSAPKIPPPNHLPRIRAEAGVMAQATDTRGRTGVGGGRWRWRKRDN